MRTLKDNGRNKNEFIATVRAAMHELESCRASAELAAESLKKIRDALKKLDSSI